MVVVLLLWLALWPSGTAWAADACPTAEKKRATLIFTGDILLDRGVHRRIAVGGADSLFSPGIDSLFRQADVVVGNLECPATSVYSPMHKNFVFRADPEHLEVLRAHGFTHLNMANNHTVDQGRRGLMDTRDNVLAAGMVPVGAGENMEEAARPVLLLPAHPPTLPAVWLVASNRLPLEHFAYLPDEPSVSQLPFGELCEQIRSLRASDPQSVIVVSLHWGWEHHLEPLPQQCTQARELIDAGADLLVCHHTHTLQSVEVYCGRRIYYGIGNFIFDQEKPLNTQACIVRLTIGEGGVEVETLPISIEHCRPRLVPPAADNR